MIRRAAVPVALLGLLGCVAALGPAADAGPPGPKPVSGGHHQAYRATQRRDVSVESEPTKQISYRGPKLELGASYLNHDAVEPTLGVTRSRVGFYAAAGFDTAGGTLSRTDIMVTRDGGRTWGRTGPRLATGQSMPPATLDPYVWVDPVTDRVFTLDLYVGCAYLSYSDDLGETWTQNPFACGIPGDDHQTIVTGPTPAGMPAPDGYPNYVYYCVNKIAGSFCARSVDGGNRFLPTGAPAFTGVDPAMPDLFCGGLHGHVVTDRKGRLFMPKGHCRQPWLAVSEDGGQSWRRHQVSNIRADGIQTAVAVDAYDNVYYTWWDAVQQLPYLSVSRDHGRTWSAPVMVAPPGVAEVNFPSIAAAGKGRVVITFPGTRDGDSSVTTRPWNYYVTQTMNALEARPLFVSATANSISDPIHRGACRSRCAGMFDFLDVVISPAGEIWAAAVDTCTAQKACNTATPARSAPAPSMAGVAVRQLSGPGLPARR